MLFSKVGGSENYLLNYFLKGLLYSVKNNDSLPPKDTIFHHLAYVAR